MSLIIILIALNISITITGLLLRWKMGAKMMQAAFRAFWQASKCSWNLDDGQVCGPMFESVAVVDTRMSHIWFFGKVIRLFIWQLYV